MLKALHRQQELLLLVRTPWVLLKRAGIAFDEVRDAL